jgi:spermidine synthase
VIEILIFVSIIAVIPAYERLFYYFYRINTFLPRNEDFFFLYEMTQILICFLAILLPTVFIGMSLPVASRVNVKSMDHLGRGIGNIFSFNIMGNITGSLVTGFLLIPFIGLEKSLITGMALNFIAGAFVLIHAYPERKKMTYSVSLAGIILIACFFIFPLFNRTVLQSGMYRVRNIAAQSYEDFKNLFKPIKLLYYKDGSSSTVSVIEDKGFLFLKVGGKTDASNHHDMATQVMLGQIGLLLNADAKDVFVLGLGSGVTANSASTHENVRSVEVAEISPEVIEASEFFNTANEEISKNPKVKIINADGREYLRLNPEKKFDVIISEPSNPWMAGIGSLFTKEFFTEVSSHLNEKGLMVQWIHIYEMNDIIFSIILHTFGAVFPNVTVWSIHKYNDILLVGSNEPVMLNIEKFKGKFLDTKILKDLEKCKVAVDLTGPLSILSMQILSNFWFRYHFSSGNEGLINSDNFPVIEYEAPKAFFAGENAHFILEIDERKLSRSRSHLFLKKFLSENTFKPEDANNILSSFRQEMKVTNANLAKYMIEYLYDSSSVKSIVHYLRFLDTSILGNNILYSALISNPDFSTEDCISYLKFKEAYIENKKSIFYSPDLKEIEENYSKCLTKFPENKPEFKSSLISIYRSAGDLEKEKTVLLDLLGSDSISQDDRILLSKELAKVEFYSGNPAGSRKIFEGLKNDKEVSLYLDEISRIEKK